MKTSSRPHLHYIVRKGLPPEVSEAAITRFPDVVLVDVLEKVLQNKNA
jgi:hypothetical protein